MIYRSYDQRGLDAQYDNRAMVPGHAGWIARWRTDSESVRARLTHRRDLAYGPGERERVDYFPAAPGAPLVAFLHGGYWRALSKDDFSFPAGPLAARGIAYAAIGYPLIPSVDMDGLVAAVDRALAWLAAEAGRLGHDPARIVLCGHSAGGHLAALMAARHDMAGFLALSGLYELEPIRLSYLNAELGLGAAQARRNGPMDHPPRPGTACALAVGALESDEYRRQQADYAARLSGRGLAVEAAVLPDLHHFSILDPLAAADGLLVETLARLAQA